MDLKNTKVRGSASYHEPSALGILAALGLTCWTEPPSLCSEDPFWNFPIKDVVSQSLACIK